MDREQFLNSLCPNSKNVVLTFEHSMSKFKKCKWFVHTTFWKDKSWSQYNDEFWKWVTQNCAGLVMCYMSSSEDGDWWGFEHKNDALLFKISWS